MDQTVSRLDRKCAAALAKAVDSFPDLLEQCEASEAAAIVADLIKARLTMPVSPRSEAEDAAESLKAVLIEIANKRKED